MEFDFGVNLAFWLTIASTAICVIYGLRNWNHCSKEEDAELERWARSEQQINEGL